MRDGFSNAAIPFQLLASMAKFVSVFAHISSFHLQESGHNPAIFPSNVWSFVWIYHYFRTVLWQSHCFCKSVSNDLSNFSFWQESSFGNFWLVSPHFSSVWRIHFSRRFYNISQAFFPNNPPQDIFFHSTKVAKGSDFNNKRQKWNLPVMWKSLMTWARAHVHSFFFQLFLVYRGYKLRDSVTYSQYMLSAFLPLWSLTLRCYG